MTEMRSLPDKDLARSLTISQYERLCSEIEKRLELRQQLLTFVVIMAGTFLSIGVQAAISSMTLFCYPILALFIAAAMEQGDRRIGQIAHFILVQVEPCFNDFPGWESHRKQIYTSHALSTKGLLLLSTRGLFLTTQILALTFGIVRSVPVTQSSALLFSLFCTISVAATVATWFVLQHKRDGRKERNS